MNFEKAKNVDRAVYWIGHKPNIVRKLYKAIWAVSLAVVCYFIAIGVMDLLQGNFRFFFACMGSAALSYMVGRFIYGLRH